MSSAINAAQVNNWDLGVPFQFETVRAFRTNWMRLFIEGREYIGMYHSFTQYAKLDSLSLTQYAAALAPTYAAMSAILATSGDPVVVTSQLRSKAMAVVSRHRDVPNSGVQSMLDRVEFDLTRFEGKPRSYFMASMHPMAFGLPGASPIMRLLLGIALLGAGMLVLRARAFTPAR